MEKYGIYIAPYGTNVTYMKQNKYTTSFNYSALISPIAPRVKPLDGIGSLFNITGTYYNINPNLDALCKASEHIVNLNEVWKNVGNDLFKAVDRFAELNNIAKISAFQYNPPKFAKNPWEYLLNPKKY